MNDAVMWWIQFVDIPALAGIIWWMLRTQASNVIANTKIREDLTALRLKVAEEYVSASQLKDALKPMTERIGAMEETINRIWKNGW